MSEDLDKVLNFNNKIVDGKVPETILEFKVDANAYRTLTSNSTEQTGFRGIDAIEFNMEGITNPTLRNIGIPSSKLEEFNKIIQSVEVIPKK